MITALKWLQLTLSLSVIALFWAIYPGVMVIFAVSGHSDTPCNQPISRDTLVSTFKGGPYAITTTQKLSAPLT